MTAEQKILLSRAAMAEWLGITRPALDKHRDAWRMEGDRFDAKATTAAYCAALREAAEARGGEARVVDLATERARLAKEQADERSIKNTVLREGLISAAEAAKVWAQFLVELRMRFTALPEAARRAAGLTEAQVRVVEREVLAALDGPEVKTGGTGYGN